MKRSVKKEPSALGKKLAVMLQLSNFETIKQFEEAAGIRPDAIRRLIGGYKRGLTYIELQKVATALKTTPQELCAAGDGESITTGNLVPGAKEPCWFQIRSDEMLPTLHPGSFVLVDTGIKSVTESGIYLLGTPSSSVFRRISFNPLSPVLHVDVDNKSYSYSEDVYPEKIKVEGRIIGVFERI
nr:MAG TPA: peptidase [Caudoviricetes sp.]